MDMKPFHMTDRLVIVLGCTIGNNAKVSLKSGNFCRRWRKQSADGSSGYIYDQSTLNLKLLKVYSQNLVSLTCKFCKIWFTIWHRGENYFHNFFQWDM